MRQDIIGLIIGILLIFLLFASGYVTGQHSNEEEYQKLAIENGCGQYNSQSGKFEWLKVNK